MDGEYDKDELKKFLQKEVSRFYRRDRRIWKAPIVRTLRELQETDVRAVFFGGTLRSLLISRLFSKRFGRPRDVDIVVSGISVEALRDRFEELIARETRFGGLQLRRDNWQFDLWPLHQTWAFVRDRVASPVFSQLPDTTFFNLEAIAVEVWPQPGYAREMFSGDDKFFEGILSRTLEINREENPYPELCVLRALVMASAINFSIGPNLARYIAQHGQGLSEDDLEYVQNKHYGKMKLFGTTLKKWIGMIADGVASKPLESIKLPIARQRTFWTDDKVHTRVNFHGSVT